MTYLVKTIIRISACLPAVIIGGWRYRKMNADYKPLFWRTALSLTAEIASTVASYTIRSNSITSNLYSLIDFYILLWLFHRWRTSPWLSRHLKWVIATGSVFWLTENFIVGSMQSFNTSFDVAASFLFVFLSIRHLNNTIWQERGNLLRNTKFLAGFALLLFFTVYMIVTIFWVYSFYNALGPIISYVFTIQFWASIMVSLIFAFALWFVPTKPRFVLLPAKPSASSAHSHL